MGGACKHAPYCCYSGLPRCDKRRPEIYCPIMSINLRAIIIVPAIILTLCGTFAAIGCLLDYILGFPARLDLHWAARAGGFVVLGIGFGIMGWLARYRRPIDVLVSTYVTIQKSVRKTPPAEPAGRTEPLVVRGPQKYVRNPMYFAVFAMVVGWWLVFDYTFILWLALFLLLWFNLVVIRFEEAELKALYGQPYIDYMAAVPRFFPRPWRKSYRP
jgi:protein-S-isoprenylcysteine O-methyltransferase Ste14